MTREIGGSLPVSKKYLDNTPNNKPIYRCNVFKNSIYTFSARSALSLFLDFNYKGKKKVILPLFTCSTCIKPFVDRKFSVHFYNLNLDLSIDERSLKNELEACEYECIIYIHSYFGWNTTAALDKYINELRKQNNIIVINDFTHAWLSDYQLMKADWYVASIRKWLETPDGGVLASDNDINNDFNISDYNKEQVEEYVKASLLKNDYLIGVRNIKKEDFYPLFKHVNSFFRDETVYAMSPLSKTVYQNTDFEFVKEKRRQNAKYLCAYINNKNINKIFIDVPKDVTPFYYPVYIEGDRRNEFQAYLASQNIFCPVHWTIPEFVLQNDHSNLIYPNIISLVCDQRYDINDMDNFVNVINSFN